MSQYSRVRAEMASAREPTLACSVCGTPTDYATLSDHGGRCFGCYQAHCREPIAPHERSRAAQAIRAEIASARKKVPA